MPFYRASAKMRRTAMKWQQPIRSHRVKLSRRRRRAQMNLFPWGIADATWCERRSASSCHAHIFVNFLERRPTAAAALSIGKIRKQRRQGGGELLAAGGGVLHVSAIPCISSTYSICPHYAKSSCQSYQHIAQHAGCRQHIPRDERGVRGNMRARRIARPKSNRTWRNTSI